MRFKQFLEENNKTIDYEWNRPLDGSEKELSKKYGIKIKVINQMHAEITGDKKKILNFLKHEDDLIKSDPDMIDVLYSELDEAELDERIQILSDEKIDDYIEKEWGRGQAYTYEYNIHAATELAKIFPDILVTKDMKYMHIPGTINAKQNTKLNAIEDKYKLKDLQKSLSENKVFDYLGRLLNIKTTKGKPDFKDAPNWAEYLGKTPSGAYHWISNKVDLDGDETYFDDADKIKFSGFVGKDDGKVSLEKIK